MLLRMAGLDICLCHVAAYGRTGHLPMPCCGVWQDWTSAYAMLLLRMAGLVICLCHDAAIWQDWTSAYAMLLHAARAAVVGNESHPPLTSDATSHQMDRKRSQIRWSAQQPQRL